MPYKSSNISPISFPASVPKKHRVYIRVGRRRDSMHVKRKDEGDLQSRLNSNTTLVASPAVWGLS